MRKKKNWSYYRKYNTTQERRAYFDHPELVRAKRRPSNIPNSYWDGSYCHQKSWKVKRTKQYRGRSELNEFHITVERWVNYYDLTEYLSDHDIPYRVDKIYDTTYYERKETKRVKDKYIPAYTWVWGNKPKHQIGWTWTYKTIYTGKVLKFKGSYTKEYRITYWAKKELDLDFVFRKIS